MRKQDSIFSKVIDYVNSHVGGTYAAEDFCKTLVSNVPTMARFSGLGPYFRVRTYQTYLHSAGFIKNVKKGHWAVVHRVPDWVTLNVLETLRGYKDKREYGHAVIPAPKKEELRRKLSMYLSQPSIKPGDRVKVLYAPSRQEIEDMGWHNSWVHEMNEAVGGTYTVARVSEHGVELEEGLGNYDYPSWVLELVGTEQPQPEPDKIDWKAGMSFTLGGDSHRVVYKVESVGLRSGLDITWASALDGSRCSSTVTIKQLLNWEDLRLIKEVKRGEEVKQGTYATCTRSNSYGKYIKDKEYEVLRVRESGYPDAIINEQGEEWMVISPQRSFTMAYASKKQSQEEKTKEAVEYRTGQRFCLDTLDVQYLMAQISQGEVALINLESGNRFANPVRVKDVGRITQEEFYAICNSNPDAFTKR